MEPDNEIPEPPYIPEELGEGAFPVDPNCFKGDDAFEHRELF